MNNDSTEIRTDNQPVQTHEQFNLLHEIGRGALYRGGEDAEDFLAGYGWGTLGYIAVLVVLWIIGSLIS